VADTARPTLRELRSFGLLLGAIFAALFGVVPLLRYHHGPLWPWILAGVLWIGALLRPATLRYLHSGWTKLGSALGWLNTRIILTLLFAISIVPIGLAMRLFGRDRMGRRFEPKRESYRVPNRQRPAKSMEHPF
jgi:Saxitoxin biosynthesis operon protein SxtJ